MSMVNASPIHYNVKQVKLVLNLKVVLMEYAIIDVKQLNVEEEIYVSMEIVYLRKKDVEILEIVNPIKSVLIWDALIGVLWSYVNKDIYVKKENVLEKLTIIVGLFHVH